MARAAVASAEATEWAAVEAACAAAGGQVRAAAAQRREAAARRQAEAEEAWPPPSVPTLPAFPCQFHQWLPLGTCQGKRIRTTPSVLHLHPGTAQFGWKRPQVVLSWWAYPKAAEV